MKCRAAVLLIVVLTAVGAAAQSGTNGSFQVSDPTQFFGTRSAALNRTNATFSIDAQTTNSTGELTFFHVHADSTVSTQDSWLLVLSADQGMPRGTYQINGGSVQASLTNFNNSCNPTSGSFTIGTMIETGGTVSQGSGNFTLNCTTTATVTGSWSIQTNTPGNGGGGGGGGGGVGGGFGSGGVGRIPGLGAIPSGPSGATGPSTPSVPPNPELSVSAPLGGVEIQSGGSGTVRLTTVGNSTFNSSVSFTATGPPGLTFAFSPSRIESPGSGTTTLTIGTSEGVSAGDQTIDIVARGENGVVGRTSVNLRIACDPPFILGLDQPKHTAIARGSTAALTVKPSGSGPFTYQWYEGHRGSLVFPIAGATSATFTTPALNASTEYWVRVSNPCGTVDSQNVSVNVTP